MALVRKVKRTNHEVWTFGKVDLNGGGTVTITTDIDLDPDENYSYDRALDDVRAIYKETERTGSPLVADPEITRIGRKIRVAIANTAAPGNRSGGEVMISLGHSAVR